MVTIEEIGYKAYNEAFNNDWGRDIAEFAKLYAEFGANEQRKIDIETIPQLYVRWLMIEGEKPTWEEYANTIKGE